jgi:hypothetical protein
MGKEEKNADYDGFPEDAVKVKEIGSWVVFFYKAQASVYFRSAAGLSTALRLSRGDLLMLAQEMEAWSQIGEKAAAATPLPMKEEVSSAKSSRDKRHFRRFTRRCEAEFTYLGVSNRGLASDFSINGLFIRTNHPFGADTVIDVMVHLPDGSVSSLRGKVKRAMKTDLGRAIGMQTSGHKNGMGLELVQKDVNYLNFIRSLLK